MKLIDYVIIWWFLSSVMINYSIWLKFWKWVFKIWGFCYKLYVQVNSWFLKYNWTVLNALEHASFVYSIHASYRVIFSIFFFSFLTLSDVVCPWFSLFSVFGFFFVYSFQPLASWLGRLEPIGHPPPPLLQLLIVIGFELRKTKKPMRSWTSLGLCGLRGKLC